MKRLIPLLSLLAACVPDIPQNPPPTTVTAQFDPGATPPVAPSPNDLAKDPATGKLAIPDSPSDSAAQQEFNHNYLDTLTGFPRESTAEVTFSGPLDPTTVSPRTVVAVDLTATPPQPVTGLTPLYDPARAAIDVAAPSGGWTTGHMYAMALVAGSGGLRGAHGETVVGSPTWALVSSPNPLVQCPNGNLNTDPANCTLRVDVIPSSETDPAKRLLAQTASAMRLEAIRVGYAPVLRGIASSANVAATDIPILWTFTIVDAGEVAFDPANGVIPFPNDVLRSTAGKVTLPLPGSASPPTPAQCMAATDPMTQLYCGLNTLDGFSTIAAPVSAAGTNNAAPSVVGASLDPTSPPTQQDMGLFALPGSRATAEEQQAPIEYTPCVNCVSSAGPQSSPQKLQWRLDSPLAEATTYAAYVTTGVKDAGGKGLIPSPAFALVRLSNPLVQNGKSQVSVLTDSQAAQLEPLRLAMQPVFSALSARGVDRGNVALAWAFTTQTEGLDLDQIYSFATSAQTQTSLALPQGVVVFADATAQYTAAAGTSVPIGAIGKFYVGVFETPVTVTGPGGTFDTSNPKPEPVTFALAVPSALPPASGYPLTIFGHGLTRDRNDFLAIA
ncbi:MAG TPA: hypothetical protein VE987_03945, partial [Polyangiaceae bacterium]|nr:hypothetical protein [Polyangiaceae bacterium]